LISNIAPPTRSIGRNVAFVAIPHTKQAPSVVLWGSAYSIATPLSLIGTSSMLAAKDHRREAAPWPSRAERGPHHTPV
jgi:hypothetical protein